MKKLLCVMLSAVLVVSCAASSWADYDNEGRDGFTEAGAYIIDSIDDLKLLRDRVNAATEPENRYYRLEIDMNLTQETGWEPIGYANPFRGHFDGNGHTIYLNITRTSSWYDSYFSDRYTGSHLAGLFGYVSSSGYAVKNLNINATQISATHSGGIAYRLDAGTIENCHFTGTINSAYYAGGIAGYLNGGTVKNCTVNAFVSSSVHSETTFIGGIVGNMTGGNIENCEVLSGAAIGARTDSTSSLACGGGIVGYANIALDDTIKDCRFNAAVGSLVRAYYDIDYHRNNSNVYCGGIVGYLTGGTLQNNHVLSEADIFSDYTAGGIAGRAESGSTLESNDVAVGARAQANGEAIGGIVGLLNVGTVKGNTSYTSITGTATHQGGVIGKLEGTTATISGNKYNGAEHGIGFDASGFPSELGCERIGSAISITTSSPLPAANAGTSYSQTFAADSEETLSWSHVSGDLPAGLTLNASTGTLSGTPTTAGTFTFTISAADQYSSANKVFTLTVNLVITTDGVLPSATVGSSYTQTLRAAGASSLTWTRTAGTLPAGLTLNTNGTITGTPTTTGTSDFTVQASAGSNITATKALRITVEAAQAINITTTSLPAGKVGASYTATLAASVSGVTWSVSSGTLPAGLTLNASTGTISGTPTTAGTSTFTVRAANSSSSGTKQLSITVAQADTQTPTTTTTIAITTTSLPSGTVGNAYRYTLQANASVTSWSVSSGSLPSGLSLDSTTGTISGTLSRAGSYTFTIQARNANANTTRTFTLTVANDDGTTEPKKSSGGGGCDSGLGIWGAILSAVVCILRRK